MWSQEPEASVEEVSVIADMGPSPDIDATFLPLLLGVVVLAIVVYLLGREHDVDRRSRRRVEAARRAAAAASRGRA